MAFALLVIGVVLLVAGVRGQEQQLFRLVQSDFTGQNNFIYWFIAIVIIGSIGYIDKLKPLSHGFLILVLIGLLLHKQGFFNQFQSAINSTETATPSTTTSGTTTANTTTALALLEPLSGLAEL